MTGRPSAAGEQPAGSPEHKPQGIFDRVGSRDVALVVAICLTLITLAAGSLGVFIITDRWVTSCGSWGGIG